MYYAETAKCVQVPQEKPAYLSSADLFILAAALTSRPSPICINRLTFCILRRSLCSLIQVSLCFIIISLSFCYPAMIRLDC